MSFDIQAAIRKRIRWAELDRAVVYAVLSKGWEMLAGVGTILLIGHYFSPEIQGYHYTFFSILALQAIVEMGLGTVIVQFASHEWAKLNLDEDRGIVGDSAALSRLKSLTRAAFRWYPVAGGIVAIGIGAGGITFFTYSAVPNVSWIYPWLALCALTGLSVCLQPFWSLIEGCNQLSDLYTYRLVFGIVSSLCGWIAIVAGARLWVGAIMTAAGLLCAVVFLGVRFRQFFLSLISRPTHGEISWSREIWPMQWRIAISWLSGFLCFSLFTPTLFWFYGPILAGQMGMTWYLVRGLQSISIIWVMTKAPQFGVLIARRDYETLDRLFRKGVVLSLSIATAGAAVLLTLIWGLVAIRHPLATRFLSPLPTALLLIATILMQIPLPQGIYLRAYKQEPLMPLSVATGILTAGSNVIFGAYYAEVGVAAGYLAVVLFFAIPACTLVWRRCKLEWQQ